MPVKITWLGHASVMIQGGSHVVYIDPWKIGTSLPKADIILITHDHFDHYSEDDIKLLSKKGTVIVSSVPGPLVDEVMKPGDTKDVRGIPIKAIPSYNIDKEFHPKVNRWVGYIVTVENKKVYHAGDTDRIPEMEGLDVDVALLPVGGTYTMDAASAIDAIEDIKPRHVIPIHFGDIVGTRADAERLLGVTTAKIHVLAPSQTVEID